MRATKTKLLGVGLVVLILTVTLTLEFSSRGSAAADTNANVPASAADPATNGNPTQDAVADESEPVELTRGQARTVRVASGGDADLESAVAIDAPSMSGSDADDRSRDWVIIPNSDDGACVYMGAAVTCSEDESSFESGNTKILTISADMRTTVFNGLVPDGFATVRAVDADGSTLAETPVQGNVYSLTFSGVPSEGFELELVRADGSVVNPYR